MRLLPAVPPLLLGLLFLCGCHVHHTAVSSGPDFSYDTPLSVSPSQPGATQAATFSFSVTNYSGSSHDNVPYIVYLDGNLNVILTSGTVPTIPGNGSSGAQSFTTAVPTPGPHTISVFLDPGNTLRQADMQSDISSVVVIFADFALDFSGTPTASPASPTSADTISINFAVENLDTSGNGTTATDVAYEILESTATPDSGFIPVTGQSVNVLASGTIPSIAANMTAAVSVPLPPVAAGVHEYTIVINPLDTIAEQNVANNSLSLEVTVAASN